MGYPDRRDPLNIGAVVLDATAFRHFESESARERIAGSLRTSGLRIRITAMNALELVRTPDDSLRQRLLSAAAGLLGDAYVVPDSAELLRLAGEAELRGETRFEVRESRLEWLIREPERITPNHVAEAERILREADAHWEESHREARRIVRPTLKEKYGGDPWGSVGVFLDQQWTREEQLAEFLQATWELVGLPGKAPADRLLANEVWRMYYEAHGAVIYERAVLSQLPKPAHMSDIRQLIYLSGAKRRILVTDDKGFSRLASSLLVGRYPGSRVLTSSEFIALAG